MGRPPIGDRAMTAAERQRRRRAGLTPSPPKFRDKAPVTEQHHEALVQALAQARQELADAKERNKELHHFIAAQAQAFRDEVKRRAAKPKAEKPALPPDEVRERRIKALTTQVRNLTRKLRYLEAIYDQDVAARGGLPRATQIAIDKALHPDTRSHLSEDDKDTASKLWNAWKDTRG